MTSCQERTPSLFQDITGVYFNNLSSVMAVTDSLDLTFVYESGDVMEVPVKIQLVGRSAEVARPLEISVSSEDAVEGVDYILPEAPVMPEYASDMEYVLKLIRTDALKKEKKTIELRLHPNEAFELPVTELVQISDTVSLVDLKITFSDMFTKAPSAWEENLVGTFTQQKFELICKVLGIEPADFNDPDVITLAKLLYISSEMTEYVEMQKQLREEGLDYDEDAFDQETGEPLNFR